MGKMLHAGVQQNGVFLKNIFQNAIFVIFLHISP